jgi:hypothetical protein
MDMDIRDPMRVQPERSTQPEHHYNHPAPTAVAKRRGRGKRWFMLLLILALIAGAGGGGWYYRDMQAKDEIKAKQTEVDDLQASNSKLQTDLEAARATANESESQAKPSQKDLDNIEAAVKSGNYAALEQLMQSKITVIIAASEGVGERTPEQAVEDLKYLDGGTDPWNFDLPDATIAGYQSGDYKQYFPAGALVGKSANDYLVSFVFNNAGKVSVIFLANNADGI